MLADGSYPPTTISCLGARRTFLFHAAAHLLRTAPRTNGLQASQKIRAGRVLLPFWSQSRINAREAGEQSAKARQNAVFPPNRTYPCQFRSMGPVRKAARCESEASRTT